MNEIEIQARAKINIGLFVKGRRSDGFHELESFFQEIDFYDIVTVKPSDQLSFETDSTALSAEQDNLCLRAARLLKEQKSISGADIKLQKNIPIGAGLGGGSSDAAAVLRGLNILYDLHITDDELQDLGSRLGSDVPFFIRGGSAHVSGRGEVIRSVDGRLDYSIVLVLPEVFISTPWAYKNLNLGLTKKNHNIKLQGFELQQYPLSAFQENFKNDFENLVYKTYPDLKKIKQKLSELGAEFASLSGSGAAIYGLFSNAEKAGAAAETLKNMYRVVLTHPHKKIGR